MSQGRITNKNKKGLRVQTHAEVQFERETESELAAVRTPVPSPNTEREAAEEAAAMARQHACETEGLDEDEGEYDMETAIGNKAAEIDAWNHKVKQQALQLEERLETVTERRGAAGFGDLSNTITYNKLQVDILKLLEAVRYVSHTEEEMACVDNKMEEISLALDELEAFLGIA